MKYFSMFSGIGGFELGIKKAYSKSESEDSSNSKGRTSQHNGCPFCVGYSEIDKHAIKTYEVHFPNHKNFGDATKIIPEEIPDFDMLCGGFPCQSFSIAGKRLGFEDTRGTLFFDIARIIKRKKPRVIWLENVKGLLSHDNGRTIACILATLDELGYNAEWEVLNSKYFGVPQNRERVFIIGHFRGTSGRQIFPIGQSNGAPIEEVRKRMECANTITKGYHKGRQNSAPHIMQMNQPKHSNDRIYSEEGISHALNTMQGGSRQPFVNIYDDQNKRWLKTDVVGTIEGHSQSRSGFKVAVPVLTPDRLEKRQNGRRFKDDGEEMFTLTGQDKHGISNGSRIRRLTPIECERLQGFPDNWTIGSDTQRYKQCGNAVTVNVIQAIAEKLIT